MVELKYKDITEKILGASFEVYKFLGNGTGGGFSSSVDLALMLVKKKATGWLKHQNYTLDTHQTHLLLPANL